MTSHIAALAMAVVMSSWEASDHSQSCSPVFAELPRNKRSCDGWVGPAAEGWWAGRLGPLAAGFWKQGAPTPSPALGTGWGVALSSLFLLHSREGSLWGFFKLTVLSLFWEKSVVIRKKEENECKICSIFLDDCHTSGQCFFKSWNFWGENL